MSLQAAIENRLSGGFNPVLLEVVNESHQHAVPADSETHFKVVMVSDAFEGKRRIARHQAVYGVLEAEMSGGVHALTMHLYTPQEWQAQESGAPQSPPCMGGSKAG